jgi:hypothetical protein
MANLTYIGLANASFSGPLPPSWQVLPKLQVAQLYNNTLNGTLPGSWSRMGALHVLDVSVNNMTGRDGT